MDEFWVAGMKVEFTNKWAWLDMGNNRFVAIGTEDEVKKASINEIGEMILAALAMAEYGGLTSTKRPN